MIQILVSTMGQKDYSLLDKMNILCDAIVVNQSNVENKFIFEYNNHKIIWINSSQRGLSKSRNVLLQNATADYCVIADDDEVFDKNRIDSIQEVINRYPTVDIFRFKIEGIESKFKEYSQKTYNIGYLKALKISSVELVIKREAVINNNIFFDELIGAGTKFLMGEENAFIYSCLRKKLLIRYIPIYIAKLHIGDSSWFKGFNKEYFRGRGASFTSMSKSFSCILIIQFAIRKYKLYKNEMSITQALKYMFDGKKEYLKMRNENEFVKE